MKIHDAWWTDGDLAQLMTEGRHDAVCLYLASIGWAHMHDTDGHITPAGLALLERMNGARTGAAQLLCDRNLWQKRPGGAGGTHLIIRSYLKWQTARDQREHDSERKRNARRTSKTEREREGTSVRASDGRTPPPPPSSLENDDGPFATTTLDEITHQIADQHPTTLGAPYTDSQKGWGKQYIHAIRTQRDTSPEQ